MDKPRNCVCCVTGSACPCSFVLQTGVVRMMMMMMIPGDKLPRFRLILADFRRTFVDKRPSIWQTNYGKPTELPLALRQNFGLPARKSFGPSLTIHCKHSAATTWTLIYASQRTSARKVFCEIFSHNHKINAKIKCCYVNPASNWHKIIISQKA